MLCKGAKENAGEQALVAKRSASLPLDATARNGENARRRPGSEDSNWQHIGLCPKLVGQQRQRGDDVMVTLLTERFCLLALGSAG
jgi:hypothetical protein